MPKMQLNSLVRRNRSGHGKRAVFATLSWASLHLWVAAASAATFTASLDRDAITLGEQATLSLTFSGGAPQTAPGLPEIPGLQIDYVGPSSQVSIVNGAVSSTWTYSYRVSPRQAGEFTIPAMTADAGGEKLQTQALKLRVLKPGAPPPDAIQSGTQAAFLKLVLPKKEVYLGEVFPLKLEVYLNERVSRPSWAQQPTIPADGLSLGNMAQSQETMRQIGNGRYKLIPFYYLAKAVKTGALTIGPVTASLVVIIPSPGRRGDPFLDPFGLFGQGGEQKQLALASDPETLQCLPLPGNAPAGFNGAVGAFAMTVSAGPTNVTAGDPITLHVQISGSGALDSLTLPELAWRDFKAYPPTSKVEPSDQLGIQGTKSFEQVVVPQNSEVKELPSLTFSFFDPGQKSYRTLTQPPIALLVRPGGTVAAPTVVAGTGAARDNPPPAQDIIHIKPRPGTLALISPPLIEQRWFLAMQGLPVLAWVAGLVWRKRAESLANNPRLRRQRQVAITVRQGLDELRQFATANKSDEFFATLFRLLQEQLGERLDLPASAITEAVVESHLRPRGVAEALLRQVQEAFQTCNLARYAPIKSGQELAALVPGFEALLRQLQALKA